MHKKTDFILSHSVYFSGTGWQILSQSLFIHSFLYLAYNNCKELHTNAKRVQQSDVHAKALHWLASMFCVYGVKIKKYTGLRLLTLKCMKFKGIYMLNENVRFAKVTNE